VHFSRRYKKTKVGVFLNTVYLWKINTFAEIDKTGQAMRELRALEKMHTSLDSINTRIRQLPGSGRVVTAQVPVLVSDEILYPVHL